MVLQGSQTDIHLVRCTRQVKISMWFVNGSSFVVAIRHVIPTVYECLDACINV